MIGKYIINNTVKMKSFKAKVHGFISTREFLILYMAQKQFDQVFEQFSSKKHELWPRIVKHVT